MLTYLSLFMRWNWLLTDIVHFYAQTESSDYKFSNSFFLNNLFQNNWTSITLKTIIKFTFSLLQFVDLFSLVLLEFSPLDPLNQRLVQFHLLHHWNSCLTVICCISVSFPIVCCVAMLGQPLQKNGYYQTSGKNKHATSFSCTANMAVSVLGLFMPSKIDKHRYNPAFSY